MAKEVNIHGKHYYQLHRWDYFPSHFFEKYEFIDVFGIGVRYSLTTSIFINYFLKGFLETKTLDI